MLKVDAPSREGWWRTELARRVPDIDVRIWPDTGPVEAVDGALVWGPPPGDLARYPNLQAIFSIGAGVDHIINDPDLPAVPLTRMVDTNMTERMREYVVLHVLRYHRRQPDYDALQRARRWEELDQPHASGRRVGVLGLGELGTSSANALALLGFDVAGWSRRPKSLDGVTTFHGAEGLPPFLAQSEILVCLLPLTAATRSIIDAGFLAQLPAGAALINAARGDHVVDPDLMAALDSGHISGATLDVFSEEPLPPDHPYWGHPKVTVTPHISAITDPVSSADQVAENIHRLRAGKALINLVDLEQGY